MNKTSISNFQATLLFTFRYFLTRIRPKRKTKKGLITKARNNENTKKNDFRVFSAAGGYLRDQQLSP